MPSTTPFCAISTARSIAAPASVPANAGSALSLHAPTDSSTGTAVPLGPTSSSLASRSARPSRTILATISGPIPRGSPSVTARRGAALTSPGLGRRSAGRRVETNRHVRLLAQRLEESFDRALLDELRADALAKIAELVLAALLGRDQLGHHELGVAGDAGDRKHHNVARLFVRECLLIARRHGVARHRRQDT